LVWKKNKKYSIAFFFLSRMGFFFLALCWKISQKSGHEQEATREPTFSKNKKANEGEVRTRANFIEKQKDK